MPRPQKKIRPRTFGTSTVLEEQATVLARRGLCPLCASPHIKIGVVDWDAEKKQLLVELRCKAHGHVSTLIYDEIPQEVALA